jgi:hypothetical protein
MRLFLALLVLCTAASLVKEADAWWWGGYGFGLPYYGFAYNPFFNYYGGYFSPFYYGYGYSYFGYPYLYGKRDVTVSKDTVNFENMTHCVFSPSNSMLSCHKIPQLVECEITFKNSSNAVAYDAFGISAFNYTELFTADTKIELYPRYLFAEMKPGEKVDQKLATKLSKDAYYMFYAGNEKTRDLNGIGIKNSECFEKVVSFLKFSPVFKAKLSDERQVSVIAEILEQN